MGRSPAAHHHHHHQYKGSQPSTAQEARPDELHRSGDPFDPGGFPQFDDDDGRYELPVPDLRSSTTTPTTPTTTDGRELEMDHLHPEEHNHHASDDEEAGLTSHERRKRWHMRRRQRRQLDSRVVDLNISMTGRRLADRNVLKKLATNVLFIFLWYLFSLSISVVSIYYLFITAFRHLRPLF